MGNFKIYFDLGRDHILDIRNGYDHILFVVALCTLYQFRDWRRVTVLVTAFTIGHSVTLALATLNIIHIKTELIEFLIPLTIFITAVQNIFKREDVYGTRLVQTNYVLALLFGLIHGMGFSNYLRAILGKQTNLLSPLFAFNVGLEFGQLVIVIIFLSICFIFVDLFGVDRRDWKLVISSAIAGISLILIKDAVYW